VGRETLLHPPIFSIHPVTEGCLPPTATDRLTSQTIDKLRLRRKLRPAVLQRQINRIYIFIRINCSFKNKKFKKAMEKETHNVSNAY